MFVSSLDVSSQINALAAEGGLIPGCYHFSPSFLPHSMSAHLDFSYLQSGAKCSDILHSGSHKPQHFVSCIILIFPVFNKLYIIIYIYFAQTEARHHGKINQDTYQQQQNSASLCLLPASTAANCYEHR